MSPEERRWLSLGLADGALLWAGCAMMIAGVTYHQAALVGAGVVIGGAGAVIAIVILRAWVTWHREHGSHVCFIFRVRFRRRVHHLHWPKAGIVACTRTRGFRIGPPLA